MKVVYVQWLRGLAASMVIAFHAFGHVQPALPAHISALLDTGVDLFFVISGFVIWITTDSGKRSVLSFIKSRIVRIVPLYWLATAVVVLLAVSRNKVAFSSIEFAKTLFFIPYFNEDGQNVFPITGVGWTLNLEMFFYTIFAATLLLPKTVRAVVLLAGFPVLALAGLYCSKENPLTVAYTNPIVVEFALGVLAGIVVRREPPLIVGLIAIVLAAVMLALALLVWEPGGSRILCFGIPYFELVVGLAVVERFNRAPSYRLPLLLGNASYSIYLFHGYPVMVAGKIIRMIGPHVLQLVAAAVGVVLSAGVGVLAYWFLERPLTGLFTSRRKGLKADAAA